MGARGPIALGALVEYKDSPRCSPALHNPNYLDPGIHLSIRRANIHFSKGLQQFCMIFIVSQNISIGF